MSNLADNILNAIFTNEQFQKPQELWLALFTPNGEVVGGNYSRVNITNKFDIAVNGVTQNSEQINFSLPTVGWGTITRAGVFDAEQGGNLIAVMDLQQAQNIGPATNVFYNTGQLQFSLNLKNANI